MRDLMVRIERAIRRRMGLPNTKWSIQPFELSEQQIGRLRSEAPGPVEAAFYNHSGRIAHKWSHYLPIYDRVFAQYLGKPISMLEIGVNRGGSLELWRTVFGPHATIVGIDINPEVMARVDPPNLVMVGSQDDPEFLRSVIARVGPPDIVLDDGSHVGRHVITSFETIFPLLNDGGIYVIEDLQTSYWPGVFKGGFRRRGTAVEFLKGLVDDVNGRFHGKCSSLLYRDRIESIQFFSAMAVVEKCRPKPETGHLKRGAPQG